MRWWLILWAGALLAQEYTPDELAIELKATRRLLMDWGGLTKYGSDNAELKRKPGEQRVVFLGDEITENWVDFFPGKPYLNRGIARQATPQMLVRFRQDVISLEPKVVVIQAGLNDLAGYAGPATEGTIIDFYESMVDLAKAHGIKVILASLTPVGDYTRKLSDRRPFGRILGLNNWLKQYAAKNGCVYLDYFSLLAKGRAIDKELTADGLLPNAAGYAKMTVAAEAAIAQALK